LRFLCIVSSNLDEFFEIREAGIKEQLKLNSVAITTDGKTAREVYRLVSDEVHAIVKEQYALLNEEILPQLAAEGIRFLKRADWNDANSANGSGLLLPRGDAGASPRSVSTHRIPSRACSTRVSISPSNSKGAMPSAAAPALPSSRRRASCRASSGCRANSAKASTPSSSCLRFCTSSSHELFAGMKVLGCYQFRVTRNSDLFVDEEEVKNLRAKIQGELPQRHFGDAVRLEVANSCSEAMTQFLLGQFNLTETDLYRVAGPVNLVRLMQVPDWVLRDDLKFQPFKPGTPKALQKEPQRFRQHPQRRHPAAPPLPELQCR
jgi:polyphosphate kinase